MGEPLSYPVRVLHGKASCTRCGGKGTLGGTWEEGGEPCSCIEDQLVSKTDFIRLTDGDIEIREAE